MNWQGVVIHHSASKDVSANEIDRWHRARGFAQIGYHFVIRSDGTIELGRPWNQAGAHAASPRPSRNRTHLGICVTGHFGEHSPTVEQMDSLLRVLVGIRQRFGVDVLERHHDECPGRLFPWGMLARAEFDVSKGIQ